MYPSSFLSNIHVFTSFLTFPFLFFSFLRSLPWEGLWLLVGNGYQRPHATRPHEVIHPSINPSMYSSTLPSFLLLLKYLSHSLFLFRSAPRFNSTVDCFAFFLFFFLLSSIRYSRFQHYLFYPPLPFHLFTPLHTALLCPLLLWSHYRPCALIIVIHKRWWKYTLSHIYRYTRTHTSACAHMRLQ